MRMLRNQKATQAIACHRMLVRHNDSNLPRTSGSGRTTSARARAPSEQGLGIYGKLRHVVFTISSQRYVVDVYRN